MIIRKVLITVWQLLSENSLSFSWIFFITEVCHFYPFCECHPSETRDMTMAETYFFKFFSFIVKS